MHQGFVAYRATGTELGRSLVLIGLAEVYRKGSQVEKGLSVVAEAVAIVNKTGMRRDEVELRRLKGELTLQKQSRVKSRKSKVPNPQPLTPNTQAEAEACFLKAIEVSQRQQAKSLELRATMSLARLWQQQDKRREARTMLSNIYTWFTEGFDTKDLQEAKALIEELSR